MNKMLKATGLLILAACTLALPAQARKKKSKTPATPVVKDSLNADYKKVIKGASTAKGLFTTHFNAKEGKLYFELPDSVFDRDFLLANRIAAISNTRDYVAGQMATTPLLLRLSKDERNVYLHQPQQADELVEGDPIRPAFEKNFYAPILKGFKIMARNGKNVVIEVTSFFGGNEKCISPIKQDSPLGKLLGASSSLKGTFVADASGIMSLKTFEGNIEIKSRLSYTLSTTGDPYTVVAHRSLIALPKDRMRMRLQDNRVGYFYSDKSIYSTQLNRIEQQTYIHRWRLEPKPEDLQAYLAGAQVEPLKPIVFYVDTAFPQKWRNVVKQGIEDWNTAFEAAGFKHAIRAVDYPANDPDFDPDDMRYSCFKYAATATANAMGPSHVDPRTGEILTADVIWYHNILSLLHNWRFVQTGTVDPRVRRPVLTDEVMAEAIRYAAAHEIGHTLGLMHNMGASYSYPTDSLRSPSFTQRYGTTPSIMDYARNNYVAQPGDMERGVRLTPPLLGVYDIHAINWGYRLIPGAETPEAEKATLDAWIAEKQGDAMYEFGAQQLFGTVDPTDLTEDLGDDHIKASNAGIANLKLLLSNLETWGMEQGARYDELEKLYLEIINQYTRYVRHVIPYIGGIRYEEIRQGDGKSTGKHYIHRDKQREALLWLLDQARTYNDWLTPPSLIGKLELHMNNNEKLQAGIIGSLLASATLYRIEEGGRINAAHNYTLQAWMDDVTTQVFRKPTGGRLTTSEQQLQAAAIAAMIKVVAPEKSKASVTSLLDMELPATYTCCHAAADDCSFARINFGLPTLPKAQIGALFTARLRQVARQYKAWRSAASAETQAYYDYQLLLIEQALKP